MGLIVCYKHGRQITTFTTPLISNADVDNLVHSIKIFKVKIELISNERLDFYFDEDFVHKYNLNTYESNKLSDDEFEMLFSELVIICPLCLDEIIKKIG